MSASKRAFGTFGWGALFGVLACAPPQPAPKKPAAPLASVAQPKSGQGQLMHGAEPSVPELRTGRIQPIEHAEPLLLKVRRHAYDGEQQVVELVLPEFASESPGDEFWLGTEARLSGRSAPLQLVSPGQKSEMVLWLRRPKSEASGEIAGDAYTPSLGAQPGHHFRFRAQSPSGAPSPTLVKDWAADAAGYLSRQPGAFGVFAMNRLRARYRLQALSGTDLDPEKSRHNSAELASLMDTFTGRSAVQEALAHGRGRIFAAAKQARTLPIATLQGPKLARHPWAELSKRLGGKQPEEALAKAVPAEFYFVRANSFTAFTRVLDFVERFAAPAADLLDGASSERGSLPRYLAELGIESSDLSRVLGPEVVQDFALTGSDPYVHEGSDVTLLFRLKSPLLFRAALEKALAAHGAAHGGTQASSFIHERVKVDVARSPDGRVRQHRATVAELELVSNSPAAIRRVISAALGKVPRLADELDFRYMLARDASVPAELFGFIGDRFVQSALGPGQKIAQARRQIALAELSAPPFAALLFGWVHGQSPTDKQQLLRSGLLQPDELKHHEGARIEWAPGAAPRSAWGTPAALEPLIDLPAVTKVSAAEREAYASFARNYELSWSEYIDPIALRVESSHRGGATSLHAELRVLPLLPRENANLIDAAGDGQVDPPELASGVRFSLGIGEQSYLRELATRGLSVFASSGRPSLQLDWLGEYAAVGLADRNELVLAIRNAPEMHEFAVERPASDAELGRDVTPPESRTAALAGLPLYVVIGLRSRAAAAVALAALRQMAESTAPGVFTWGPFAQHRGIEVVRVTARERADDVTLYYALAADSLLVSLSPFVMRTLLDQALDGGLPRQGLKNVDRRAQVVLELAPQRKGALKSVLSWALLAAALEGAPKSRALAEAVLRGVPESAHDPDRSAVLLRSYFGSAPLTPDGRRYRLLPDGVADPLRGTAHAPEWPKLPTADSPTDRVLSALLRLRSDLSFEDEPEISGGARPLRSLRARVDFRLR